MDVLHGLAVMAFIALVPGTFVLLYDHYTERTNKRHQAMQRHPVGKGR
jgi:hypothetical protein